MFKNLPKNIEFRLLAVLACAALVWHLGQIIWQTVAIFSDVILVVLLSWILAFILDPLVNLLTRRGLTRLTSVAGVYVALIAGLIIFIGLVVPRLVAQLSALGATLPDLFAQAPGWTIRLEGALTSFLTNSLSYIQTLASFLTYFLLVTIISFYFLLSRDQILNQVGTLVPKRFKQEYFFLQKILTTTFATFLRVQLATGVLVGLATVLVLAFFAVDYSLSAGILAGLFATIPLIGPVISLIFPILAGATVSWQKGIISGVTLFLAYQLIYNLAVPGMMGSALKVHPLVVVLSFVIGFKIAGFWGAIFAIPIAVTVGLIAKEVAASRQRKTSVS